ncbi:MAG TPA: DHA2 family efflux MFS transporter permease subunit [Cellvibrio sp.]
MAQVATETLPDTPTPAVSAGKRGLITASVMLATIIQALDTTIANVALPHMQGSMSATQDQISWVLTSYIVAAAIFLPLTGFLSDRFGRKRLMLWSIAGFTITSMLCGAAQNLPQVVIFRLLQGIFGAALVPLSQSILLDTYPKEKHSQAMAVWGMGVVLGPILGPTLGGLLTEHYSWRWVFYINVPLGALAFLGVMAAVKETSINAKRHFDLLGFAFLSLGIGALQMMLDRGESQNWFNSPEIIIECILMGMGFYWFISHIFTYKQPFIEPAIFKDRNFSIGLVFMFVVGIILLATMALLPPFLQNLLGYPVVDVGLVMAPRGMGVMFSMMIVGKIAGKVDPRFQVGFGLILTIISLWEMTLFNTSITSWDIVRTSVVQGVGLGFIFVPLSAIAFASLEARFRNEGTALFSLTRNIGSSIGISVVMAELQQNIQRNHAAFADYITPYNQALAKVGESGHWDITTTTGLVAINNEVQRQAATLAYLQDFQLMMWVTIAALPLLLLLRKPQAGGAPVNIAAD